MGSRGSETIMTNEIVDLLNQYSEALDIIEGLKAEKTQLLDTIIPPDLKLTIADLSAEWDTMIDGYAKVAAELAESVKQMVIEHGATVKGVTHMVTYVRGRVSWNDDYLVGLAVSIPEILTARKEGAPSAQIRAIK